MLSKGYAALLSSTPAGQALLEKLAGCQSPRQTLEKQLEGAQTMPNIQELREQLRDKTAEMRRISHETPPEKWSDEHARRFNTLERECLAVEAQMGRMQSIMDREAQRGKSRDFSTSHHNEPAAGDGLAALGSFALRGETEGFGFRAALTEEAGSGGVLVPAQLASEVLAVARKYSPLRGLAKTISIQTSASKFTQAVVVDGAGTGWVGEDTARPATAVPKIEGVAFPDAEVYANVPLTAWIDEDTQAGDIVVAEIGKAFGRQEGEAFITGDGSNKPVGILHGVPNADGDATRAFGVLQYVNSGSAEAVTADGLINLLYALLPEYRVSGAWIMNSATIAAIRKLKTPTGDYLWADSLAPGQPPMLLGYKVVECGNMPDVTAGAFPIAFGDFTSGYHILDRNMIVLRDPFTNKPFVNIYARKRVSGAIVDSCAIKLLKVAAA